MAAIGIALDPAGGIRSRIADRLRLQTRVDQGLTTPPSHQADNVSRRLATIA